MRQLYSYGANESNLNILLYVKIVINVVISLFYKEYTFILMSEFSMIIKF